MMRKIILGVAVSLDGFIEGPNGEYDWCFMDQDYGMTDFLKGIDAILYGRKSYEMMKKIEGGGGFSFGRKKNYILSTTLKEVDPGYILIPDLEVVKEMKKEEGKNIWLFGGASLTSSLMKERLVDEMWLAVHPILLGAGKPMFQDITQRITLALLESKVYDTGLVSLKYRLAD
jgi:dihydrofolate reductase